MADLNRQQAELAMKSGWLDRNEAIACLREQRDGECFADTAQRLGRLSEAQATQLKSRGGANTPESSASNNANSQNGTSAYLNKVLEFATKNGASDLHIHAGSALIARVHGKLRTIRAENVLSERETAKIIREVLNDQQWAILQEKGQVDLALSIPGLGRFRTNAFRQNRGYDLVCRIIPEKVPTLQQLGLPESLSKLVDYRTGLVLCTGPIGCGKSTTLAALIQHLAYQRSEHIITMEDPIEFVYEAGKSQINQRQVGRDTQSYSRALRAALREDPDVIAITELRNREAVSLALTAAETGHLVLGTLHTNDAAQTITRVISSFPADEQEHVRVMLAESLRAVFCQRLLPRADGKGQVIAHELLYCTTAVQNLIKDDKTHQLASAMQTGKAQGMAMLDESLQNLLRDELITLEVARAAATRKELFPLGPK